MLYFFMKLPVTVTRTVFLPIVSPLSRSYVLQLQLYKIIWEDCHSLLRRVPMVCIFNAYPRPGRVVLKYMDKKPVSTDSQLTYPGTRGKGLFLCTKAPWTHQEAILTGTYQPEVAPLLSV